MPESSSTMLVVDIGNTRIKFALFQSGLILEKWHWNEWPNDLGLAFEGINPSSVMLSCTGKGEWKEDLIQFFQIRNVPTQVFGWEFLRGIEAAYQNPETLGLDRMAALLAASHLYKQEAILIADLGTCLTLDVLLDGKKHLGGSISPGLSMRFKAMHEFTAALPLGAASENVSDWGKSTKECLTAGAVWGLIAEIEHGLKRVKDYTKIDPLLILTGGDAEFFAQRINSANFVAPDLVLHGLYLALKNSDIV